MGVMLAVLTPDFYKSKACLDEISQALKHGLEIIPVSLKFDVTHTCAKI